MLTCIFYDAANYIDGKEFLDLTDHDVREMVPAIGIAKKISRLIPKPGLQVSLSFFAVEILLCMRLPHSNMHEKFTCNQK